MPRPSDDPIKRQNSLRNLPNMAGKKTRTTLRPGQAIAVKSGARSRMSQNSPSWPPAVRESIYDLEARVGAELRGPDGEVLPWAVPSIEAVALARIAAWRCERWLDTQLDRGAATPEHFETHGRVVERYHKALEREGLTLRSRLEAAQQAPDLARYWAAQHDAEQGGDG